MTAAFDEFQRELIVENTMAGLANAKKSGRVGGRPAIITPEKIRSIESMIKDKDNYPFVKDVIKAANVPYSTFYRHFNADRINELRST